jgi:hypothetical protein
MGQEETSRRRSSRCFTTRRATDMRREEMIAPHRSNRSKPPTQDRRRLRPLHAVLARRALLRLDNGNVASSSAGSTTLRTCSASFSSPVSLSSSDDFEIGSSHPCNIVDLNQRQMLARAQNLTLSFRTASRSEPLLNIGEGNHGQGSCRRIGETS